MTRHAEELPKRAASQEILPNEVRETINLYLDGKIDQWYSLQDRRGVVFILNVTDPTVAHEAGARHELEDNSAGVSRRDGFLLC
jgi:hypothetical protein